MVSVFGCLTMVSMVTLPPDLLGGCYSTSELVSELVKSVLSIIEYQTVGKHLNGLGVHCIV